MSSTVDGAAQDWTGLLSLGSGTGRTTVPTQETAILTVREQDWRPNVFVKGGVIGDGALAAYNSLVRLYARGEGGICAEIGRGRMNRQNVRQVAGTAPANLLQFIQPLITAKCPAGGAGLEVTWIADQLPGISSGTEVPLARFEISTWGKEGSFASDDSPPAQATSQYLWTQQQSIRVAPTTAAAPPHDSYLIEALFFNRSANPAYVYLVDNVGFGEAPVPWLQLTPAILVPAGSSASYTPRRPLYFTTAMQILVNSVATGPSTSLNLASIDALITWV
jgi:hypothetical protein